jgi:uncharacterized protein
VRWVLILLIQVYRLLPDRLKRRCLFKETCSALVLRMAREAGFLAACRAMRFRFSLCRPAYSVYYDYGLCDWQVEFPDHTRVSSLEIADFVLEPYHKLLGQARQRQSLETSLEGDISKMR